MTLTIKDPGASDIKIFSISVLTSAVAMPKNVASIGIIHDPPFIAIRNYIRYKKLGYFIFITINYR